MIQGSNSKDFGDIVQRALTGDRSAFGILFEEYYGPVFRFVQSKVFSKEEAEDIVSDVFARVLQSPPPQTGASSLLPYLIVSARNAVIDRSRKKTHVSLSDEMAETLPDDTSPDPESSAIQKERFGFLMEAFVTLSPEDQKVLSLSFFDMKNTQEIGAFLGKTPEAVRQALSRSLRRLRTHIEGTYEKK